jgi:CheY-like chemotaxis protein
MSKQAEAAARKHVLVVDDNVDLAVTYQELLQAEGYRVSMAHDGAQALKLLAGSEVAAVVCDLSMPHLDGDMFHNAAVHVRPELDGRFVFVTGHAVNSKFAAFLKRVNARVLCKPVPAENLIAALRAVVNPPPP